jgi:hypothetical protein
MIGFIRVIVGLVEVLESWMMITRQEFLVPGLRVRSCVLLNKTSEKITRHQALSTMHLLLSYAQNKGTIPIHQVSNLSHFGQPSVPAVRNLARRKSNKIKRGWYRTLTAGTVP